MSGERKKWLELQERKRAEKLEKHGGDTIHRRAAELLVDKLGKHPHWDVFLEDLAKKIAVCERHITASQMTLMAPGVVSNDDLMRAKISLHSWQSRMDAYKEMMEFPSQVVDSEHES